MLHLTPNPNLEPPREDALKIAGGRKDAEPQKAGFQLERSRKNSLELRAVE